MAKSVRPPLLTPETISKRKITLPKGFSKCVGSIDFNLESEVGWPFKHGVSVAAEDGFSHSEGGHSVPPPSTSTSFDQVDSQFR